MHQIQYPLEQRPRDLKLQEFLYSLDLVQIRCDLLSFQLVLL